MFLVGTYVTFPWSPAPPATALQVDVSAVNDVCTTRKTKT
jgi:hypothetical protein